jgi:hypothetical protein
MSPLDGAPLDVLERLLWLAKRRQDVTAAFDDAFRATYFQARLEGLLDPALELGLHSRKTVMRMTRAENEARGRAVRWGDGRG